MSKLVRQKAPGANFGPVSLWLVNRADGGTEATEVTFIEYSPDMRNRFIFVLLFILLLLGMGCAILLFVVGLFTIDLWWGNWEHLFTAYPLTFVMIAGTVIFFILCFKLRPPFKAPVRVYMDPEEDRVEIYRNGKLAEVGRYTEIQGVGNEPHPKLEEAIVAAEADPKRSTNRALINRYKLAQVLYLHMGQPGMITHKIEVAAFRVSKSSNLPMQARSAIHTGWEVARQVVGQGPIQPAQTVTPDTDVFQAPPRPAQEPVVQRRRRRGKID